MIPEIEALLEKAQQSLHAAESLHTDGYFNFAASRLYYAMFYVAQALLLSRGQSYSSHSAGVCQNWGSGCPLSSLASGRSRYSQRG